MDNSSIKSLEDEFYIILKKQALIENIPIIFCLITIPLMLILILTTKIDVSIYLAYMGTFILIAGISILCLIIYQLKLKKVTNKIDCIVKQKYRIEELDYYPSIEMNIYGNPEVLSERIRRIYEYFGLSKIRVINKGKCITAKKDMMPKGILGIINLFMILIRQSAFQIISAKVEETTTNNLVLNLSVSSPYKGLDYILLKDIEHSIKSNRDGYKVLSLTKPTKSRNAIKIKWTYFAMFLLFVLVIPLSINYYSYIARSDKVIEPILVKALTKINPKELYQLFTFNGDVLYNYYVVLDSRIYWCSSDDSTSKSVERCFYYDVNSLSKSEISTEQYFTTLGIRKDEMTSSNALKKLFSTSFDEKIGSATITYDASYKYFRGIISKENFGWYTVEIFKENDEEFKLKIYRDKNTISNLIINDNKIYWKEYNKELKQDEIYLYILSR